MVSVKNEEVLFNDYGKEENEVAFRVMKWFHKKKKWVNEKNGESKRKYYVKMKRNICEFPVFFTL